LLSGLNTRKSAENPDLAGNQPVVPLTISREALLVDGGDQVFRKLVHAFFAFNVRHEMIRDGHARFIGLAGTEYTILISIAHLSQDGPVNVKSVAEHLHVTTGFITNTTRKLQTRGLVKKTQDQTDKRKTILTVTDRGIALLEELAPFQRQVNDAEFGALSRAEFLQLSDAIERLVQSSESAIALQDGLGTDTD
jgi:MarR family transcriptional regulator, organic hydroperoxide resistance regulator